MIAPSHGQWTAIVMAVYAGAGIVLGALAGLVAAWRFEGNEAAVWRLAGATLPGVFAVSLLVDRRDAPGMLVGAASALLCIAALWGLREGTPPARWAPLASPWFVGIVILAPARAAGVRPANAVLVALCVLGAIVVLLLLGLILGRSRPLAAFVGPAPRRNLLSLVAVWAVTMAG